jgi:hypothetical protein
MAGLQILVLAIGVRIPAPEPMIPIDRPIQEQRDPVRRRFDEEWFLFASSEKKDSGIQ